MPGHVFIAQGDLTKLACDGWLLPCDRWLDVLTSTWFKDASAEIQDWASRLNRLVPPAGWGDDGERVAPLEHWPAGMCRPWLVNVGRRPGTEPAWYADGVRQFLRTAGESLRGSRPPFRRSRPLLGIPLAGTGYGGAHDIKGDVVRTILEVLYNEVGSLDLDVVLMTFNRAALAAAQAQRKSMRPSNAGWPELDSRLFGCASGLAAHAARGDLVLFIGAGINVGAGLPTWKDLLRDLAELSGMSEQERTGLARLQVLDQARIIQGRLTTQGKDLGRTVAERVHATHYSLAHALLAALPVRETVTTNYDTLFESASMAARRQVAVLPYQPAGDGRRWLLKMHGCVRHPEDIVLTREDFMRYRDQREALAGIVQALLITRHMLFVGFSLSDDNFHRIADAVRKAIRTPATASDARPFGTAALLFEEPFLEELWRDDLTCISMIGREAGGEAPDNVSEAARRLDIFLDLLLAEATSNAAHLLSDAYQAVLSAQELKLREALKEFEEKIDSDVRASPAWAPIGRLLDDLGRQPER